MVPPACLFDMDGTLIDSDGLITLSWQKAHESICPTIPWDGNRLKTLMGRPSMQVIEGLGIPARFRANYLQEFRSYFNQHYKSQTKLFPSVEDNLGFLKEELGLVLGVVTGARESSAKEMLSLFNIVDFFDIIVGADTTARGKPHAEPVLHALNSLQINKNRKAVPFIGDNINDLKAAHAAGIISVLYCPTYEKVPAGWLKLADHILYDFNEVKPLIERL
ncbi:MAG: HAD family hydrolase [Candidatus Odinarchaeota archaeon]